MHFWACNEKTFVWAACNVDERFVQIQLASLVDMFGEQAQHLNEPAFANPLLEAAMADLIRQPCIDSLRSAPQRLVWLRVRKSSIVLQINAVGDCAYFCAHPPSKRGIIGVV